MMTKEDQPKLNDWNACEYDPETKQAAYTGNNHAIATVLVGSNGKWRLCESCAALPEFRRFTKRRTITWKLENRQGE